MIEPARSFDRAAEEYEATRPSYPDALLELLPVDPGATVLDLGAGTGKLTRVLARRYARVIAVEPLDNMRAILERVVPEAEVLEGGAASIPLPDASVDAVFAAQAFHWFATDEAVAEIARVLRSGGIFADVWNETEEPTPLPAPYQARLQRLFATRAGAEDDVREEVIRRGPFGEVHLDSVLHEQVQSRDAALTFMRSISYVAKLPEPEREALMDELGSLLPEGDYRFTIRASARWAVRT
ncbi:MAG TPA: class I SAM-dependent methyltransferase [Gaiellaceae bacterium]|nr:class I SAM-dependent methyltransferase [Gaiellaceae bacterium]